MGPSLDSRRMDKALSAYSAAAMYGAAACLNLFEALFGASPATSVPGFAALAVAGSLVLAGSRLPRWVLAPLGPMGVALIAYAQATSPGAGDGAVLYVWPVLWTAFFFGLPGAIAIVLCVGVAHGVAVLNLPTVSSYFGRWVDVMVSVSVVATVVELLARRNETLLARLAREARTDKLTGLLNRRGLQERATVELARVGREGASMAVASLDVDYFKRINDEWGHDVGDQVLARLGVVLSDNARKVDVIARVGGEEFVALLPWADSADAVAFTQRVRLALAAPDHTALPTVRISAGVISEVAPSELEPLLLAADSALYAAKRAGRDRTLIYEPEEAALSPQRSGELPVAVGEQI
jgi:diguanylate cyclase (GGDEF)-like protein